MAAGICIRKMIRSDIPQVSALERKIFSEPWSGKGFEDTLALDYTCFLVAERFAGYFAQNDPEEDGEETMDGHIAGYCGAYFSVDEAEITNVAVREQDRGQGIGHAMLEELIRLAGQRGVHKIFLEVRVSNETAIRLYRSFGFEPCGLRKEFYFLPIEDALCMSLQI